MSTRSPLRVLLVSGLLFVAVTAVHAEDYKIQIHRDYKVGQKLYESINVEEEITQKNVAAEKPDVTQSKIGLKATVTITQVNKNNDVIGADMDIDELTNQQNGADVQMLPKGTKIKFKTGDGKPNFTVEKPLPPEAIEALSKVMANFAVDSKIKSNLQDAMASPVGNRKPGDSWPMVVKPFIDARAAAGKPVAPGSIVKGRATLLKIEDVDGVKAMRFETRLQCPTELGLNLPVGAKIDGPNATTVVTWMLPIDLTQPPLGVQSSQKITTHIEAQAQDDKLLIVDIDVVHIVTMTCKVLPE